VSRASNCSGSDRLCRHSEALTSEPSVRSHLREGLLLLFLHGFDRCCERHVGKRYGIVFRCQWNGGADARGEKIIVCTG